MPDEVVETMLAFMKTHDLHQQAEELCRVWIRSSDLEDELIEHGLMPEDIQLVFERCALVFDHGILKHPFVETLIGLYVHVSTVGHFRGQRPIGHYRLITGLDGTEEDDYFVLDKPRQS